MAAGGGGAAVIETVATEVLDVSETDVAVTVTVTGAGALAGAVYVIAAPEGLEAADKVPQEAPEQAVPFNDQATPLFCASFCTVTVMALVLPVCPDRTAGLTVTLMGALGVVGALTIVIVVVAVLELSVNEVALTVTTFGLGAFAGAL